MELVRSSRAPWLVFPWNNHEEEIYSFQQWLQGIQWENVIERLWTIQPFYSTRLQKIVDLFFQFPVIPIIPTKTLHLSFEEYVENSHFVQEEDELAPRIFEDLKREYATFNGENLIERAWSQVKGSDDSSFFEAKSALYLSPGWPEIEKRVKAVFVEKIFPEFAEEACREMSEVERRAFLGSFHQGSGTIFSTIRHLDRGGILPYRVIDHGGKITRTDQRLVFMYEASLGEQVFLRKEGGEMELQYGPAAEKMVATVDFTAKRVSISIAFQTNPLYGQ